MTQFAVELNFHSDLPRFLKSKKSRVGRELNERTSVKDVIEACGVPHTEVDLILINDQLTGFENVLTQDAVVDVYGLDSDRVTFFPENRLQVRQIRKFVADGHLGKLVRDLRLLGIDVTYDRDAQDRQLVETAQKEERALLTRDRRLLMHSAVRHGYYPRSQQPFEQATEVLRRFDLSAAIRPFSRCIRCNQPLQPVAKAKVLDRLEPLTKIYYEQFHNCSGCGQIYWSGSHFDKLRDRIEKLRAAVSARPNLT
jgi:uncharacterized protein with PIN domain